jgi:hypothetical protein
MAKSIRTDVVESACDICGRTLLRGEHAETYLAAGTRRHVCELCTARAVHEGWIRESASSAELPARRPGSHRGRSLMSRLRTRRERERDRERGPHLPPGGGEALVPDAAVVEQALEAIPHSSRHVHAVPTNADLKVARAIELFNASEHTRTVSGVARSLGAPLVNVRPSREEPSVVSLVVGWELSWYRFEVDLSDEAGGVRVVEQGQELTELSDSDQEWNAAADEQGILSAAAVA